MEADEGVGIREPAPVDALVDRREGFYLLIGDAAELEVVEDVAAGPDRFAEVLVPVAALVPALQLLGLVDEGIAEPGGIVEIEVAGAVLDAV